MPPTTDDETLAAIELGRAAMARGAWAEAVEAFDRARATGGSPEALEGLGWARYWLDDVTSSMELRERACRAYRDRGQCRDASRVATALGLDALDMHGVAVANGWFELARRCLEGVEPSPEHGWLALWEGHLARMLEGDTGKARELGVEASRVGRSFGLGDLEVLGDALVGLVEVNEGEVAAGMRRLDASMAAVLVGELNDLYSVSAACCFLLHACEWVRDYDRMAQWSARIDGFAIDRNIESMFTACRTQHASLLIGRGAWAEAEASLEKLNAELVMKRPWFASEALEQLGELRRRQGRWTDAEQLFQKAGARAVAMLGRAQMALDRHAPEEALECSERALRALSRARWADSSVGFFVKLRAHLGVSELDAAKRVLAELARTARTFAAPFSLGLHHHGQGLVAAYVGDHERARAHFSDALVAFEESIAPYEAARVRVDLARSLVEAGRVRSAAAELDTAVASFDGLGAQRDAAVARQVRGETKPEAEARNPLTAREREVLKLIADGLADKAVAAELGISEHTVHRHIANVLNKLDRPTRAAAVAYALRHRLI